MAVINTIRPWNSFIFNVDANPDVSGVAAGIGSIAITQYGAIYKKTGVLDTNWTLLTNGLGPYAPAGYYGDFYSDQTQSNLATFNLVTLNNTTINNGVSIVNNSQITVANSGVYDIQFSLQVATTTGADRELLLWLRKEGLDVPYSNTQFDVQGGSKKAVAAWNFLVSLNAGEHCELVWYSTDSNMQLVTFPESLSPKYPGIPSVILTVNQVAGI